MTSPQPAPAPEPSSVVDQAAAGRGCAVPACGREHKARGFCRTHYRRWQRHGDPRADVAVRERGPAAGRPSAWSVLRKVRAARGPAAAQRCAGCGATAAMWSYDGTDPDECTQPGRPVASETAEEPPPAVRGGSGSVRRYSLDPARYLPLCRFCHRRAVLARAAPVPAPARRAPAMDVDRAVRLYTAGASAAGIAGLLRVSPDAVLHALRTRGLTIRPRPGTHSPAIPSSSAPVPDM